QTGQLINQMAEPLSSATPTDILANQIAVMASVQNYFEFTVMTACGIGKIKLLGTREDWVKLKHMLPRGIDEFLDWWSLHLELIIDQCLQAFDKKADLDFFKSIIKYHDGSGSTYINGWSLFFFLPQLY